MSVAQGPRECWKIYLDDFLNIMVTSRAASRFFRDVPSDNQEILRQQYLPSRVPRGQDKAVEGASIVKHLGFIYNDDLALARFSNVHSLELCSIGFALLEQVTQRLLVFAGKAAHATPTSLVVELQRLLARVREAVADLEAPLAELQGALRGVDPPEPSFAL